MARDTLPEGVLPRFLSQAQAAAFLGLAPSTFAELVKKRRLPPSVRLGVRRNLWDRKVLDRFADALSGIGEAAPTAPADGKAAWLEAIRGQR